MFANLANKFKRSKRNNQEQNQDTCDNSECILIKSDIRFDINRKTFSYKSFVNQYSVQNFATFSLLATLSLFIKNNLKPGTECMKATMVKRAPALKWLRHYSIKENLLSDILSGITVAIVHIPQSMAYALLATVAPIYGLYTSFFPPLIYWIFGTSRQISIGTFAVISLMVAGTLSDLESKYVPPVGFNYTQYQYNLENDLPNSVSAEHFLSMNRENARVMIMTAQKFWVGIIQLAMFFLNFGFITSYLSESFLNGFLCGSSVHVFTSQMKFIFGIKLTSYSGIAKIPKVCKFISFSNY
jgi:sulfate anion transporter 6